MTDAAKPNYDVYLYDAVNNNVGAWVISSVDKGIAVKEYQTIATEKQIFSSSRSNPAILVTSRTVHGMSSRRMASAPTGVLPESAT